MKNELKLIEQLDWLIRIKYTGNTNQLCEKLNISKSELYDAVEKMKQFNLQVVFSIKLQSYIYENHTCFSYKSFNQILYSKRKGRKKVFQRTNGIGSNKNYRLKIV